MNHKTKNRIISEITQMINDVDVETILISISSILITAGIDSKEVVDILESKDFGELGKEVALQIKINEGW